MTEILRRTFAFGEDVEQLHVRSADNEAPEGWTVEGIAVPYGRRQRIDHTLVEQFARGAFAHQVEQMHRVHFARNHVQQGGQPIGRIVEARETDAGLWVAMRVSDTAEGRDTLTLIRDEVLSELSIGFRLRKAGWSKTLPDGVVERQRAELTEVSVVLSGAYGRKALVSGVRSAEEIAEGAEDESDELAARRDARQWLARLPLPDMIG